MLLDVHGSGIGLFCEISTCRPISGWTGVSAFSHRILKVLSIELFACFISLISSRVTIWQPALGLAVIDIEAYRTCGAIETRPNAHWSCFLGHGGDSHESRHNSIPVFLFFMLAGIRYSAALLLDQVSGYMIRWVTFATDNHSILPVRLWLDSAVAKSRGVAVYIFTSSTEAQQTASNNQ